MSEKPIDYAYDFPDWAAAVEAAVGYASDDIFFRTLQSARMVRDGQAIYARDGVVFDRIQYAWPLLSSLLLTAADCGRLHVLDFGGGFGTTFHQNNRFLSKISIKIDVLWNIVEQERHVKTGLSEFETDKIKFYYSVEDCLGSAEIDAACFLGSICYISNPYEILETICQAQPKYIVFDRTPMLNGARDEFAVQIVRPPIYNASMPIRNFGERNLMNALTDHYDLLESWICEGQPDPRSQAKGYLFRSKS